MKFTVDTESTRPLYTQLADAIRAAIERGELAPGERLPTVRQLLRETGLSDGTIRHAYEQLAREGVITLVQGSGTFVSGDCMQSRSREMKAMASIDRMLEELTDLGMTLREIQMYVSLKLSRREDALPLAKIACVDESREVLGEMALQLCEIPGVELTEYLLDDVRRAPVELIGGFPLVIAPQEYYHELRALMGEDRASVACVALAPSEKTLVDLARIPGGSRVGLTCRTERFARIMQSTLRETAGVDAVCLLAGSGMPLPEFLEDVDVLLVAPDYLAYADETRQQTLSGFTRRGGTLIPFRCRIDQGSRLLVEQRVAALGAQAI